MCFIDFSVDLRDIFLWIKIYVGGGEKFLCKRISVESIVKMKNLSTWNQSGFISLL